MSSAQPLVKRQTIKQAKADFKARGRPTLTDVQKRQIERAAQLERRAWGAKERAKNKGDALIKKERERKEQEQQERIRMGTQRRCDQFGHKSSQLHLGRFFGGASKNMKPPPPPSKTSPSKHGTDCFDDDVDDESLLEALETSDVRERPDHEMLQSMHTANETAVPVKACLPVVETIPLSSKQDFSSLWAELDSSTQVARDLNDDVGNLNRAQAVVNAGSFSSGEFDLTAEELDELPILCVQSKAQRDKQLMPPPALPFSKMGTTSHAVKDFARPVKQCSPSGLGAEKAPIPEFTMTELESFVDDDLQLTQLAPG